MRRIGEQRTLVVTALGLWSCLALSAAHAGEPLARMATSLLHSGAATHPAANSIHLPTNRLDLTPPATSFANSPRATQAFPATKPATAPSRDNEARWSELAPAGSPGRIRSPAEQLARNFRRDGLPLARLFQSENSLVHLGLNPKGKPGLWIIEKIH